MSGSGAAGLSATPGVGWWLLSSAGTGLAAFLLGGMGHNWRELRLCCSNPAGEAGVTTALRTCWPRAALPAVAAKALSTRWLAWQKIALWCRSRAAIGLPDCPSAQSLPEHGTNSVAAMEAAAVQVVYR